MNSIKTLKNKLPTDSGVSFLSVGSGSRGEAHSAALPDIKS
jgi:hypothetical protein